MQRDIPINYSMPSPLNSPFLSFLPPPFSHCSLRSLPTLLTKGFLFSHYLLRFVGRTNDIVCVCWKERREGAVIFFFFPFFVPSRAVSPPPPPFFFFLFRRSFSLLRSCVFPSIHPPPVFRRRQSERISHNDVDCSRQLTIEASARD